MRIHPRHPHPALVAADEKPKLSPVALHGLAGEIVRLIEPHTEADPATLLAEVLTVAGNLMGRGAYFEAERTPHFPNLFLVVVGSTSDGRKGSAFSQVRSLVQLVDTDYSRTRLIKGVASGEALVNLAVELGMSELACTLSPEGNGRGPGPVGPREELGMETEEPDRRLLLREPEFAQLLFQAKQRSSYSTLLRQAWDSEMLEHRTKKSSLVADVHLSMIADITLDELRGRMPQVDILNGFANRILWIASSRSKLLPEGGSLSDEDLAPFASRMRKSIAFAASVGQMRRDLEADELWHGVYGELTDQVSGVAAKVLSRGAPQVMRLSMIYALLDQSTEINVQHLNAALAFWEYCKQSARLIFPEPVNPLVNQLWEILLGQPQGISRSELSSELHRHKREAEISAALAELEARGLIGNRKDRTGGRPRHVWFVLTRDEIAA